MRETTRSLGGVGQPTARGGAHPPPQTSWSRSTKCGALGRISARVVQALAGAQRRLWPGPKGRRFKERLRGRHLLAAVALGARDPLRILLVVLLAQRALGLTRLGVGQLALARLVAGWGWANRAVRVGSEVGGICGGEGVRESEG